MFDPFNEEQKAAAKREAEKAKLAAKRQRQAASRAMTKCSGCGQTARLGCTTCTSCENAQSEQETLERMEALDLKTRTEELIEWQQQATLEERIKRIETILFQQRLL